MDDHDISGGGGGKLPNQKELEKELSEYLSKKYGNRIKIISPFIFPKGEEAATDEVLTALRRVLDGGIYLSDAMASRLLAQFVRGVPADGGSPVDRLSDRELEVFGLIGAGLGTSEIARRLHLSPKTIETYRAHIKQKLNLADATELLQHAIHYVRESQGG